MKHIDGAFNLHELSAEAFKTARNETFIKWQRAAQKALLPEEMELFSYISYIWHIKIWIIGYKTIIIIISDDVYMILKKNLRVGNELA